VQPGDRLGRYEIVGAIGKGGMGEVWRARDTSLHREVAIKTLPIAAAGDADRLARFDREAKLLAALKHPNIASIHGLEESNGTRFLVLELVEGGTLANRLALGPLPIEQTLRIGLQLAEALEAAHTAGILHRDLKPANISLTPDGSVKVLDFGLAKTIESPSGSSATVTVMTQAGVAVGTPAYMSPEQARGEAVGPQTDIWSFGVVLYELLTGSAAFGGGSTAETLSQVLTKSPDFARLPPSTPPGIERLLRRCLEKDPKRRQQHMGDARLEIEDALGARSSHPVDVIASSAARRGGAVWLAAGALVIAGVAAFAGWYAAQRTAPATPVRPARLSMSFPGVPWVGPVGTSHVAISPDGSAIAFSAHDRVWVRQLDRSEPTAIAEGPAAHLFFSPDGTWLGLLTAYGLRKVPVAGGATVDLAPISQRTAGATWHSNGTIVFATTEGLYRISENGGESTLIATPNREKELAYAWPSFLPDGDAVLFSIVPDSGVNDAHVASLDLASRDVRVILTGGTSARYVPTGHIVYAAGSALRAIRFDATSRQAQGEPATIPDVTPASSASNGSADFAVASSGTLVFMSPSGPALNTLRWIDRHGKEELIAVEPRPYGYPRVSPDGRRLALDINSNGSRDIWILDLQRLSQVRLTDGPTEDLLPLWSVDGTRVFFGSNRTGNFDIYSQAADGASPARVEFAAPGVQFPEGFTPDGSGLTVYEDFKDTGLLLLTQPPRLNPLLHTEFDDRLVQVSPDGRWVAFESNEAGTGQMEVMIRSFPDTSRRREKVSIKGGRYPLWGPKGTNHLYYLDPDGRMVAVTVTLAPDLTIGDVTPLFELRKPPAGVSGRIYDVSPRDGRFIVTKPATQSSSGPTHVSVVLNWLQELGTRVP
jgi:Tol biopolymer transport system component